MSIFVVEKSIPLPSVRGGKTTLFPFEQMEIGDSFFVKETEYKKHTVASAAHTFGKHNKRTFAVRMVKGDGISGTRVWRVK